MKTKICFMSILLLVSGIAYLGAVVIEIPDANLEIALRSALAKPIGAITDEELRSLTSLEATNKGITDLTGLEYCINFTNLNLEGNAINDIKPLAGLTSLSQLNLKNNRINDIDPLSNLTEIKNLTLEQNRISNIKPLANLVNLTYLNLSSNQIRDITPLSSLGNLLTLGLRDNQISDISPLAEFTRLNDLNLENNQISNIDALSKINSLRYLTIGDNPAKDLSPLKTLTNLKVLGIYRNGIKDISPLRDLINLTSLNSEGNLITDISPLANLTNLTYLNLWNNNSVSDISLLARLTNLTELHLSYNHLITDISPVSKLTSLKTLSLGGIQISDISPLAGLVNLTFLNLENCEISDIGLLANLTNLEKLLISGNRINDIEPLAGLTNLTYLDCGWFGGNLISDIGPLTGLVNLNFLSLKNNKVMDLQPLIDNAGLGAGDTLDVRGNPLRDFALCVQVPALMLRGVNVQFDPGQPKPNIGIMQIDQQLAGIPFWVDIYAGTDKVPVSDLFGISFKLNYTKTDLLDVVSPTNQNVKAGSFLGDDVIFFSSVDERIGQVMISVTRKAGAGGITGFGKLASVQMIASSSISEDTNIEFTITDVQAQDPDGNRIYCLIPENTNVTIKRSGIIVWPGDTDNNGLVDERDVLPIGMYWAKTGPARSPASAAWAAQAASTWTPSMATYADANGDGIVDERDVLPIGMNWHKTHEVPNNAPGIDIAYVDHARYLNGYIALLTALEKAPNSDAVHKMKALLKQVISQHIPKENRLLQNYPNPFNPDTWIPYQLSKESDVCITIYDSAGRIVKKLDIGRKSAGIYRTQDQAAYWDGRNELGEAVASGIYFYTIQTDDYTATRKMIVAR